MTGIPLYPMDGSQPESETILNAVSEQFGGFCPNFFKVLAHNPAALKGFTGLHQALGDEGVLAPVEREIVALLMAVKHDCAYCGAAHTAMARKLGLSDGDVAALKAGDALSDARQDRVRRATLALLETHGALDDATRDGLGLTTAELLEITAVIGQFTWATMVNRLAGTPVDF